MKLIINTDGGSRGNPGPAASAYVVRRDAGILQEKCGKYLGMQTNNFAEYSAVLMAWEWVLSRNNLHNEVSEIVFRLDSELVVRQIQKIYKIKEPSLVALWKQIFEKQIVFCRKRPDVKVFYEHIVREQNSEADALVNETLDANMF